METWQKDKKNSVEKKKRDEQLKNAHIKVYNQAKKPLAAKHGVKNSISSWTDIEENKKVPPHKHNTQNTLTTSDNVSEQIKKLTKKDSEEKIQVVQEEGDKSRNLETGEVKITKQESEAIYTSIEDGENKWDLLKHAFIYLAVWIT